MSEGVICSECGREFSYAGFNSHWGKQHEGQPPTSVDNSFPESVKEELSEKKKGKSNPMFGREIPPNELKKRSEQIQQAWREGAYDDRDMSTPTKEAWETGRKSHPNNHGERIAEAWEEGKFSDRDTPGPQSIEVTKTGHVVSSSDEKEVDLLLYSLGVDYEYEPKFELSDRQYTPDFQVGDVVVEVKGWPVTDSCVDRAQHFMGEYPEKIYVLYAVSTEAYSVPADVKVTDMRQLQGVIQMVRTNRFTSDVQSKVVG